PEMTGYVLTGLAKLVTFTLDVPGFPHIMWNITQIEHDAFHGRFGAPSEGRFDELAQWENKADYWRHLDRDKVHKFVRLANVPARKPDWETNGETTRVYRLIDI